MDLTYLLLKIWCMDYILDASTFLESIHFLLKTLSLAYKGLYASEKTVFSIKTCAVICQKIVMIAIYICTSSDVTDAS